MKNKITFIANIADTVRTVVEPNPKTKNKNDLLDFSSAKYVRKTQENNRWAIYCPCNTRLEINTSFIKKDYRPYRGGFYHFLQPITCGCGIVYDDNFCFTPIVAKSIKDNIVETRFSVVERKNSFALYSFATSVLISSTTKKLILKDIGNNSMYMSKRTKAIRIRTKDKVITVPLKKLVSKISSVIQLHMSNALREGYMEDGLFFKKIISPLINFCEILENKCHTNDVVRILDMIDKNRQQLYFQSFNKDNEDYFLRERNIWVNYLIERLCCMSALYMYPPFATIAINHGYQYLLNMLSSSSLMCSLTELKKKNPTKPKDIIATLFKAKLLSENLKMARADIFNKKQNAKLKRQKKKDPTKVVIFEAGIPKNLIADSRVPKIKNFKKVIKSIEFKKNYLDFFIKNGFDDAAVVLYSFFKKPILDGGINTFNKILSTISIEEYVDLKNFVVNYSNNYERINKSLTYQSVLHVLKLQKESKQNFNVIQYYSDCVAMMNDLRMSLTVLYRLKTQEQLKAHHDHLSRLVFLLADKLMEEKLNNHLKQFKHTEVTIDDINFKILDSLEMFCDESEFMHHCVRTYCKNVSNGHYVIYRVKDLKTNHRATLSINTYLQEEGKYEFKFNQLKSIHNAKATNKIIDVSKKFIFTHFKIKDYVDCHDLQYSEKKTESNVELF